MRDRTKDINRVVSLCDHPAGQYFDHDDSRPNGHQVYRFWTRDRGDSRCAAQIWPRRHSRVYGTRSQCAAVVLAKCGCVEPGRGVFSGERFVRAASSLSSRRHSLAPRVSLSSLQMHTGISQTQIGTNAFLTSRAAAAADETQTASSAHPEMSEQGASLLDTVLQGDPASRPTATALVAFLAVENAGVNARRLREALAEEDAVLAKADAEIAGEATILLATVAAKNAALVTAASKDAALAAKDDVLAEKDAALLAAVTAKNAAHATASATKAAQLKELAEKDGALAMAVATAAEKDAAHRKLLVEKDDALAAALAQMEQLRALTPPDPPPLDMPSIGTAPSAVPPSLPVGTDGDGDPASLVGRMVNVDGIGTCTVVSFNKKRSPFANSTHTLRLNSTHATRDVVLRRTKAGMTIGVPFSAL